MVLCFAAELILSVNCGAGLIQKAKDRLARHAVKLFIKMVAPRPPPTKVLQEWKAVASCTRRNDRVAILRNVWTKIEQFLSLRFCFISPGDMLKVQRKIGWVLH